MIWSRKPYGMDVFTSNEMNGDGVVLRYQTVSPLWDSAVYTFDEEYE